MDSDLILIGALVAYMLSLVVYRKTIRKSFSIFVKAHLVAPILALFPIGWFAEGPGFLILSVGTILIGPIVSIYAILILYEPISGAKTVRKAQAFLVFLVLSTVIYWALLKNEYWSFYQTLERIQLLLLWYYVFAVLTIFIRFISDELRKKAREEQKS